MCVWSIATSTWQQCGFTTSRQASLPHKQTSDRLSAEHTETKAVLRHSEGRGQTRGTGIPAEWFFLEHLSYPDFQAHNWQRCTQQHCTGGRGNSQETSLTLVFHYFDSSLCQKILASLCSDPASASTTPYAGSCGPTPENCQHLI